MTFGTGRLKLRYKLGLLVAIPLSSTFALGTFVLWRDTDTIKNHPVIVLVLLSALVALIIFSVLFIRKLATSITTIQTISEGLAKGTLHKGISVNGLPETGIIGSAINTVREGVLHQTKFA